MDIRCLGLILQVLCALALLVVVSLLSHLIQTISSDDLHHPYGFSLLLFLLTQSILDSGRRLYELLVEVGNCSNEENSAHATDMP